MTDTHTPPDGWAHDANNDAPPAHLRDLIPAGWRLTIEARRPDPESLQWGRPQVLEWRYTLYAPHGGRIYLYRQMHIDDLRRDYVEGPAAFERAVIERLVARMRDELARVGREDG